MATETPCQTSDAIYGISLTNRLVSCEVEIPFDLNLTADQAALLEANIHNALELVLAPYWIRKEGGQQ